MTRKVVQISGVSDNMGGLELFALADDGSVWRRYPSWDRDGDLVSNWERLPDIPQEKP